MDVYQESETLFKGQNPNGKLNLHLTTWAAQIFVTDHDIILSVVWTDVLFESVFQQSELDDLREKYGFSADMSAESFQLKLEETREYLKREIRKVRTRDDMLRNILCLCRPVLERQTELTNLTLWYVKIQNELPQPDLLLLRSFRTTNSPVLCCSWWCIARYDLMTVCFVCRNQELKIKEGAENLKKAISDKKSMADVNSMVKKSKNRLYDLQQVWPELLHYYLLL